MKVILNHEEYQIKNGFAASNREIGLTAHGHSIEVAKINLERTAVMFLKPFEREGILDDIVEKLKLNVERDATKELTVVVA